MFSYSFHYFVCMCELAQKPLMHVEVRGLSGVCSPLRLAEEGLLTVVALHTPG